MSAFFERRGIEENTWTPNVCGIDFSEIMARKFGEVALAGGQLWTAFATLEDSEEGPGYTMQVTPDNCMTYLSDLDDDSDAILLLDRRDQMFFRFMRLNHQEIFDAVYLTVAPWAQRHSSMLPTAQAYQAVLNQLSKDLGDGELTIPDTWS